MGLGCLGEREGRLDVRTQSAGLDEGGDGLHAAPVGLDEEGLEADAPLGDRRQLVRCDGYGKERDEGASWTKHGEGAGAAGGVERERIEDHVDVCDGLGEVDGAVVDGLVHAQGTQEVVLGGAGGADDVRAAGLGDLYGEMADAAGRRVDEDPLPGLDVGGVDQCLVGGESGERQGAGLDVVDTCRLAGEDAGGAGHVLGVGTHSMRVGQHAEDLVTRLEQGDAGADGLDDAGDVPPEDEWQTVDGPDLSPVPPVGRVDAGRADGDQDLADARHGPGNLRLP